MSYTSIRSVLVLLLIPPFCFAQGDVANELTRGEGMLAVGDRESARKSFEAARRQAEEIGDHQLEAAALIGILRTIDANFQSSPDLSDPARHAELDEAREMEKKALRIGSPAQRQAAINALGVLFLRAGMQAQALDTLSELDMQNVLPSERYIYEYNVGRALERNEHPREAFDRYVDAIGQQPTYCPSIAGALRLLHSHVDIQQLGRQESAKPS